MSSSSITLVSIRNDYFKSKKRSIEPKVYSEFLKNCNMLIRNFILDGHIFDMPYGLGKLMIVKYKPEYRTYEVDGKTYPRRVLIDFKHTRLLRQQMRPDLNQSQWKLIPYTERPFVLFDNDHTDGYVFNIRWSKWKTNMTKHINWFEFKPSHIFKKELAATLREKIKPTYYDKFEISKLPNHYGESQEGLTSGD